MPELIGRKATAGTPATVALSRAGSAFSVPVRPDPASPSYGEKAAQVLGVDANRVFKTPFASVTESPSSASYRCHDSST